MTVINDNLIDQVRKRGDLVVFLILLVTSEITEWKSSFSLDTAKSKVIGRFLPDLVPSRNQTYGIVPMEKLQLNVQKPISINIFGILEAGTDAKITPPTKNIT